MKKEELIECPICLIKYEFISAQHIKNHGFTTKEFKEKFGIKFLKIESIRKKHSALMTDSNPMSGVPCTDERRKNISEARTGKGIGVAGKYERTKEIREKISRGVALAHVEGRAGNHFYNQDWMKEFGEYIYSPKMRKSFWCDSPYEERIVLLLNRLPYIEEFEREPCIIPYDLDGVIKNYVPDFYVLEKDSGIEWLWEFKTNCQTQTAQGQAKKKAFHDYCNERHWNSFWINKEQLRKMEDAHWHLVKDYIDIYEKWR